MTNILTDRKEKEKYKLAYNLKVKSILSVIIITVPGLYSPFEAEGLSEFKRINPALLESGRLLDWFS